MITTPQEAHVAIHDYFDPYKDDHVESCDYRNPDTGYRCAVGCLIPDRHYFESFEGNNILEIWDELVRDRVFPDDPFLLEYLQKAQDIHDRLEDRSISEFLEQLDEYRNRVESRLNA
jgi:hypothetical protein